MKTKTQTGIAAILLLSALSCSKDNSDNSGGINRSTAISSSQSSNTFAETMDDAQTDQSAVGKWILCYDWYCDGDPDYTDMEVKADGTWSDGQGEGGLWIQGRHMFVFTFYDYKTTYSGVMFAQQIKGIQGTFQYPQSLQGCFHMVPYTNNFKGKHKTGTPNASGKQQ